MNWAPGSSTLNNGLQPPNAVSSASMSNSSEVSGFCREVQERVRTQGEAMAALEGTVRNQAELIGTQVNAALSRVSERFEAFTQALDAHTEAICRLDSASARADAAAQSLQQRLDLQAQAIQSVHGATQAQAECWGQLREATVGFASLLQNPVGNPALLLQQEGSEGPRGCHLNSLFQPDKHVSTAVEGESFSIGGPRRPGGQRPDSTMNWF